MNHNWPRGFGRIALAGSLCAFAVMVAAPGLAQADEFPAFVTVPQATTPETSSSSGSAAISGQSSPGVGPNLLVNQRDGSGNTQSETTVAVFGENVAHGWNDEDGFGDFNVGNTGEGQADGDWDHFLDGGDLPAPPDWMHRADPAVASCGDGTFFFASMGIQSTSNVPVGLLVNKGATVANAIEWQEAVVAITVGDGFMVDKEYLTCDPETGNVYLSYTRFRLNAFNQVIGNGQIEFIRSIDGGVTWSAPVVLQAEESVVNQGSYPAAGPDGTVCVAWQRGWLDNDPVDTIQLRCSSDEGATFGPNHSVVSFLGNSRSQPTGYNRPVINNFPGIDIDKTNGDSRGTVYVAFTDGDLDIRDVKLVASTDLGATWSAPVTLNDNAGTGTDEFFPWVSIDPHGRVGVLWYSNDAGVTDVFLDVSFGAGESDIRVTDTSTDWTAISARLAPNFGDYINLASSENFFHASWADGRHGDPDVFYAAIRTSDLVGVRTRLLSLPRTGEASVPSSDPATVLEIAGQQPDLGLSPRLLLENGNVAARISEDGTPLALTPVRTVLTPKNAAMYYELDLAPVCGRSELAVVVADVVDDLGNPLAAVSKSPRCTQ